MAARKRKVADNRLVRGFIGITRYWPQEIQEEILRKAGVDADRCYIHSWRKRPIDTSERDEAIKALGPGRVLVVCKLFLLARNMKDLLDVLERLTISGASVVSAVSGREFTAATAFDAHTEIAEAVEAYKDHHYSPGREAAKAAGKTGGSERKAPVVMPDDQARKHWFNPKLTAAQALELMTGWAKATAGRVFGPRFPGKNLGRKPGSKNKRKGRKAKARRKK